MDGSNVIWIDFRLSKDIRKRQIIPFGERMREISLRTQNHTQHTKNALERINKLLDPKK